MRRWMCAGLCVGLSVPLWLLCAAPSWAGFEEGKAAWRANDYAGALREWLPLAERGDVQAQLGLGDMYTWGWGVPQDESEASQWYTRAAKQGSPLGQSKLANQYYFGKGVPRDKAVAAQWYRKAAMQGESFAQSSLAEMLYEGDGIVQDKQEALKWYRLAATNPAMARAQNSLGEMIAKGEGGAVVDPAEAVKWYTMSAQKGYVPAQYHLARAYLDGWGVARDNKLGLAWLTKAADRHYPLALTHMGALYEAGEVVAKDMRQAFDWYALAAQRVDMQWIDVWSGQWSDAGDSNAMLNLGRIYEHGLGVERNLTAAYALYQASVNANPARSNPAYKERERMEFRISTQAFEAGQDMAKHLANRTSYSFAGTLREYAQKTAHIKAERE